MDFKEGVEFLMTQGAMLAMLPIEEWLADFNHADSVAHVMDPTMYRKYIFSGRDVMIKQVLESALRYKEVILKAQQDVVAGRIR